MPSIQVNGISLAYTLDGSGADTVVLVNGLADDKESWEHQSKALLQAGYQILSFDNRGIGGSSKPPGPYSAELLASDTKALVDALEIKKFHLMGVSMGGMIAQAYALAYQSDLLSLTLACTYAHPGPFCSRMFSTWEDVAPVMGVQFVMRDVTLWAFTQDFFNRREDILEEFEKAMCELDMSVEAYLAQLAVIQNFDTRERLRELTVRTLVIAGEEDILIPVSLSHELHKLIRGSLWTTVAGGHGCMWEFPEAFNRAYIEFLSK